MPRGILEIISSDFAIGWAEEIEGVPAHVYARVGSRIVGFSQADMRRDDLEVLAGRGELLAKAFVIVFDQPIATTDIDRVEIFALDDPAPLQRGSRMRTDQSRKRQIFIFGSPRSGTSELAATLVEKLGLPWLGEGHAAPLFAEAAAALTGNEASPHDLLRFMAQQHYRHIVVRALRRAYYFMHGSTSFLDKTPGTAMIRAAPFLADCFPDAHFIYMRRNGISNVLSRLAKFGGPFDEHCADWAAAMDRWAEVRDSLPHYLEVDQEEMWDNPNAVATRLTAYLDERSATEMISMSLTIGRRERTGAGIGRGTLAATGWDNNMIERFLDICTKQMVRSGYNMEELER